MYQIYVHTVSVKTVDRPKRHFQWTIKFQNLNNLHDLYSGHACFCLVWPDHRANYMTSLPDQVMATKRFLMSCKNFPKNLLVATLQKFPKSKLAFVNFAIGEERPNVSDNPDLRGGRSSFDTGDYFKKKKLNYKTFLLFSAFCFSPIKLPIIHFNWGSADGGGRWWVV